MFVKGDTSLFNLADFINKEINRSTALTTEKQRPEISAEENTFPLIDNQFSREIPAAPSKEPLKKNVQKFVKRDRFPSLYSTRSMYSRSEEILSSFHSIQPTTNAIVE